MQSYCNTYFNDCFHLFILKVKFQPELYCQYAVFIATLRKPTNTPRERQYKDGSICVLLFIVQVTRIKTSFQLVLLLTFWHSKRAYQNRRNNTFLIFVYGVKSFRD